MIPQRLKQLESELRRAAACRQYRLVTSLAEEIGEAVRAYTETLPRGDPRRAEAARGLDEVLSWALVMMRAARSDCATELRMVTTATGYGRARREPAGKPAIRLDA